MSTQTALGQSFPTPCNRCGGALYRQVEHCPYCGAVHPLDSAPRNRTAIARGPAGESNQPAQRLDASAALARESDPTGLAPGAEANRTGHMPRTALVSSGKSALPPEEPPFTTGGGKLTRRHVLIAILVIVVIGLAYGAYALFSGNDDDREDGDLDQTAVTNQDARTITGTIAPLSSEQTAHSSGTIKPDVPAMQGNSASAGSLAKPTPVTQTAPVVARPAPGVAPVVATPVRPAMPQFRDATQALQAAHRAFNVHDLSTAQAALARAQSLDPSNTDAQNLASELRPLNARRDTALQAAQTCVAQQSWVCARQHANEALAVDTGNDTAKAILERVIRETGWAPLKTDSQGRTAQSNPPAAPAPQPAQLQTALPKGTPADNATSAAAPRTNAAGATGSTGTTGPTANSVDARERAIKDSGWSHAPATGATTSAASPPSQ